MSVPHDHTEHYDWCFRCELSKSEMRQSAVVVVDDLRVFPGLPDVTYLRTLEAALDWWVDYREAPERCELWLDHDLGGYYGDEDVRPLVMAIEEHLMTFGPLPISVRILTDNPVGRKWVHQALGGLLPVVDGAPAHRVLEQP